VQNRGVTTSRMILLDQSVSRLGKASLGRQWRRLVALALLLSFLAFLFGSELLFLFALTLRVGVAVLGDWSLQLSVVKWILTGLNLKEHDGRCLTVNEARPREERSGGGYLAGRGRRDHY